MPSIPDRRRVAGLRTPLPNETAMRSSITLRLTALWSARRAGHRQVRRRRAPNRLLVHLARTPDLLAGVLPREVVGAEKAAQHERVRRRRRKREGPRRRRRGWGRRCCRRRVLRARRFTTVEQRRDERPGEHNRRGPRTRLNCHSSRSTPPKSFRFDSAVSAASSARREALPRPARKAGCVRSIGLARGPVRCGLSARAGEQGKKKRRAGCNRPKAVVCSA
jgi:hypothetical protein